MGKVRQLLTGRILHSCKFESCLIRIISSDDEMLSISVCLLIFSISLFPKITSVSYIRITSLTFLCAFILSYNVFYINNIDVGIGYFSGLFAQTTYNSLIEMFLLLTAAALALPWAQVSVNNKNSLLTLSSFVPTIPEYSLILLFSILGASFLISSTDLISMYLALELQSFAVYILASLYKNSESSTGAGLKYFLLGALSSAFILLGSALIYLSLGTTDLEKCFLLFSSGISLSTSYFGLFLIISGFFFKVAAAPFHNWAPDVYSGVPTIVTAWISIIPKLSLFTFLFSVLHPIFSMDFSNYSNILPNFLLFSSLLSLIIGSVLGLSQVKIKRLLAYSTVSHVGFLLLALANNCLPSTKAFYFYLVQYSFTSVNIFLIILAFSYVLPYSNFYWNPLLKIKNYFYNADLTYMSELKGVYKSLPILAISLAICLYSMAGIPPFIGFFAKYSVIYASLFNQYYFLSLIAILTSLISAYYYLKIIGIMFFTSSLGEDLPKYEDSTIKISQIHSFIIALLTLYITLFFVKPSLLLDTIQLLALTIFNN